MKKPGLDKGDPANYRPITNLSTISKVLEKLALARLRPHVMSTGNFNQFQSAYRSGHSTETAVLRVVNDIRIAADNGLCTALLALDVSAAFDAVNHDTLCGRARDEFNVDGLALNWLESFVSDRTQYVAVGQERSRTTACVSGVPQGSILGPLLFAMYVSPVDHVITSSGLSYHQYADDLQLYTTVRTDPSDDLRVLERCVADVSGWFLRNGLLFNSSKTEAVMFGIRQRLVRYRTHRNVVGVNDVTVNFVEAFKLLGVTLDGALTFDKHVSDVVRACNYHIRALRHIRPLLSLDSAKMVAAAIVGARLDYCNSALHGMSERNLDRLQRVQNSLARTVCCAKWSDSATELRQTLHWLPIRQRIEYKIAVMTFNARTARGPRYLSELITNELPTRILRSSGPAKLLEQRSSLDFGSFAFSRAAPRM